MNNDKTTHDRMREYAENYMEQIFYFALKKTGNYHEAEELTSDISMNILSALHSGTIPRNFSAWIWQIARNRYCFWAQQKHRHSENQASSEALMENISNDDKDIADILVHEEELALLRRELAFVSSDYRNIVAMYYLENRKVSDIAERLQLPGGTVVSKLHRARNILREGMRMTRKFGKRSYDPEKFRFSVICNRKGNAGEPWCYMNSKLHQNIYLEGYDDPKTAETFALELGVALPYMEDELERLTRASLLTKKDNRYETAFPIISKDALAQIHSYYGVLMPKLVPLLEENIDRFTDQYRESGDSYYGEYQSYEQAKWTLLLMTYTDLYTLCGNSPKTPLGNTPRPAHGIWDVYATEQADFLPCQVGFTHMADSLYQYLIGYGNLMRKTLLPTAEEAIALCNLVRGEAYDKKLAKKLISYGYVKRIGHADIPAVAVFRKNSNENFLAFCKKGIFSKTFREHARRRKILHENILTLLSEMNQCVYDILYRDLPKNIRNNEKFIQALLYSYCNQGGSFTLGYILETALADGWLRYDENIPPSVGAYVKI
ncbi:MAG: sigma-70 family RNA polymerase sigma factor [Clostridia bacterium]|nr:sigma-70 family RNA polymerase sigma factor [Clostridia bacterium]